MQFINGDCIEQMGKLPEKSVDLLLTDPPYGYINTQFDKDYFNEVQYWDAVKRVMKDDSFVVFFGRGDTYCSMNLESQKHGFTFCEELVWNKKMNSTVFNPIGRVHELIAVRRSGKKNINRIYQDMLSNCEASNDLERIIKAVKRARSSYKQNPTIFLDYIKNGNIDFKKAGNPKYNIVCNKDRGVADRGLNSFIQMTRGDLTKSIIYSAREDYYKSIHPTQKPVALMKLLIELFSNRGETVLDTFCGSGSSLIAAERTGRNGIGFELDTEYYNDAKKRIHRELEIQDDLKPIDGTFDLSENEIVNLSLF